MATTELRTPVALEMNFGGATIGQYDQILEKMGLSAGRRGTQRRDVPLGREDRRRYARRRRLGDTGGVRSFCEREDRLPAPRKSVSNGSRRSASTTSTTTRRSLAEKLSA